MRIDVDTNCALGIFHIDLKRKLEESEPRGRIETIQTAILLKLVRILRRILET